MGGDAPARRAPGAGSIPLVPRPRVAPDELIPGRPGAPGDGPGWPGPGQQDQATGRTRARPHQRPARPVPGQPGPRRDVPARRARVVRPASAPSRTPAGRGRRTRLTRRGRRVLWAASVLLLVAVITPLLARPGLRRPGFQSRPAAVRGPGWHAAGCGQARPVPVVGRAERGAQGRPAGRHPADHGVQRAGQPGCGARREPLGPPGLTSWRGDRRERQARDTPAGSTRPIPQSRGRGSGLRPGRHPAARVLLAFPGRPQAVYRKIAEPARCRLRSTGCLL